MIRADDHVAGRFARGIRRVGRVRSHLGEITRRTQRTIDFVGGHMMESLVIELACPERATRLQQIECADNVRADEIAWPGDGTIHMRLRCEVHDMRDAVLFHDADHRCLIAQIHLLKNVFRIL